MSNSPLVTYTNITKNKNSPRNHSIDTITIHCIVGQWTAKKGCDYFATTTRKCSSNYVVGTDGSIGLSVDERDRSWCSSSATNDNRAITIEVASDAKHPYAVNEKAYAALINLLVDICKRNGIKKLLWEADKTLVGQVDKQNMTVHRWFANKACPGEYLYSRHGQIASEVNAKLGSDTSASAPSIIYRVRKSWDDKESQLGAYKNIANAKLVADRTPGYSVFDESGNVVYSGQTTFNPYKVKVTTSMLNIRKGAGTNYGLCGAIRDRGIYTIIAEASGTGASMWGKLKSGAGWISLDFTEKI